MAVSDTLWLWRVVPAFWLVDGTGDSPARRVQPGHQSKAKRIRKWKSSVFLRRSFDEYAYDDFCAVRSKQERDDYVVWVVVELLFRTGEPALEVGRFSPVSGGSSYWQKIEKTLRDLSIESPGAAALRQELAKAMGITNAGYSDNEQ
jgi:hypothetical protein